MSRRLVWSFGAVMALGACSANGGSTNGAAGIAGAAGASGSTGGLSANDASTGGNGGLDGGGFGGNAATSAGGNGGNGGDAGSCSCCGDWKIDNLSPCLACGNQDCSTVVGAVSTLKSTGKCPYLDFNFWDNPIPPSEPWSANTLVADCSGYFELCLTLKARAEPLAAPQPTDCTMQKVCTAMQYATATTEQALPDLPGWVTATQAEKTCAQAFVANGGYAELSVSGGPEWCAAVNKVFQTVKYCPLKCNDPFFEMDPECLDCNQGEGAPSALEPVYFTQIAVAFS